MLDRAMLALLRPGIDRAAGALSRAGVSADVVTVAGFVRRHRRPRWPSRCSAFLIGLVLLLASRAGRRSRRRGRTRLTTPTDRGAFLDITLDFLFYASIPLAFAFADPPPTHCPQRCCSPHSSAPGRASSPSRRWRAKRGMKSVAYPNKGLYYLGGLTEATETIACFVLMCLCAAVASPALAYGFAALCAITIATRLVAGWRELSSVRPRSPEEES